MTDDTSLLAGFADLPTIAKELNRHPRTVRRLTQQPDGLPYVRLGNKLLFNRQSVLRWLESLERSNRRRR